MRYDPPYGPYGVYGYPQYFAAVMEQKRMIRRESNRLSWTALLGIVMMTGLSLAGQVAYFRMGNYYRPAFRAFGGLDPVVYYLITAFAYVVGLAFPVLMYLALRRIPLTQALPFERTGAMRVAAYALLGCAGCMIADIPANLVVQAEQFFGFGGDMLEMPLNDNPLVLALYVLSTVIIPPIVEEMMFRGMILQGLRRFGDGFAVIASAAMFGLYHGNFAQAVFAFLCGLILGYVAVRSNSLLPAILIHFLNNALSVAIQMAERYGGASAANFAGEARVVVLAVLGALSLGYLLIWDRRFFRSDAPLSPYRLSTRLFALFTNPGAVVMVLYALAESVAILVRG